MSRRPAPDSAAGTSTGTNLQIFTADETPLGAQKIAESDSSPSANRRSRNGNQPIAGNDLRIRFARIKASHDFREGSDSSRNSGGTGRQAVSIYRPGNIAGGRVTTIELGGHPYSGRVEVVPSGIPPPPFFPSPPPSCLRRIHWKNIRNYR